MRFATVSDPLKVLVVDDDSALIRTLSDILRLHGYAPSAAMTGSEGLRMAEQDVPALAVVDLRLPDMDGVDLASRLHKLSEMTEVVVLTGNASVESAVAALREHSVDYLLKPVNVDQLLHVASLASERWQRRMAESRAERAMSERARQQAAVARLGQRALAADGVVTLFAEAVSLVAETLRLPFASVLERRSDGRTLSLRAGVGWPEGSPESFAISVSDRTQAGYTLRHAEPVIVANLAEETRFPETGGLLEFGIGSGVSVIIPGPVHPFGVLVAHDVVPREFTLDDAHFLQAIAHVLGTAVERDRTDAAFRQSQRLEAVGRLASGVSHDFNNMLTAITGYAEMVRAGLPDNDPLREDVGEILKAASRAAGLTRQLLAFSRQQVLQPRMVLLNEIVGGIEKMLGPLLGVGVDLSLVLAPDLGFVKADPGQIEQVILNLCVNARDAMPDGGALTIETANVDLDVTHTQEWSVEAQGAYVMLAVTDTGIGMDEETRSRIFEPFFTTKPPDKGTGLGLATVYGIVKQSGGELYVYSEPGRGTSFKIYLPQVAYGADTATPAARASGQGGSETVLVAEDEPAIRRVAQRILEKAGYHVLVAESGTDAVATAAAYAKPIHLLVTDVMMPGLTGRELAQQLRAARRGLRVLYLSGFTDATASANGMVDPGAFFLQKPFATDALVQKVREVLDAPEVAA